MGVLNDEAAGGLWYRVVKIGSQCMAREFTTCHDEVLWGYNGLNGRPKQQ